MSQRDPSGIPDLFEYLLGLGGEFIDKYPKTSLFILFAAIVAATYLAL